MILSFSGHAVSYFMLHKRFNTQKSVKVIYMQLLFCIISFTVSFCLISVCAHLYSYAFHFYLHSFVFILHLAIMF